MVGPILEALPDRPPRSPHFGSGVSRTRDVDTKPEREVSFAAVTEPLRAMRCPWICPWREPDGSVSAAPLIAEF
jgi:hypothetical protein